ncbi:hypothetical protein F5B19DRAFT_404290 [Rostrohypoxylon terebratum]|nr:hypothetical protein F5B19DRAFT_404290 [Rostrohypoxylon terebratum]
MSDESDMEDRVASETEEELDEVDSEESDSEEANEFLDLEASESDGETDDEDDLSDVGEPTYFHKFMDLPPELRARIWEFFDGELRIKSRVYPVHTLSVTYGPSHRVVIYPFEFLEGMVERTKTMMSVHHESRALAMTFYPDMFYLHEGRYGVPYNKERDIVFVGGTTGDGNRHNIRDVLSTLGNPPNVALEPEWLLEDDDEEQWLISGSEGTPKNLLLWADEYTYLLPTMEWCVSDIVNTYSVEFSEELDGITYDTWILYCWPDFEKRRELIKGLLQLDLPARHTNYWPIIEFRDRERFFKFKEAVATEGEWADKWSSASDLGQDPDEEGEEEEEDEYESDGIDDATIDEDGSSEDEDDLVVLQSDSEDDSASTFDGFSPLQPANLEHGDEIEAANFSSPEPEPTGAGDSADPLPHKSDHDSEHALSDDEPVQSTSRRKRRIISSDDEDELDQDVKLPSRPSKRSRVVLSDSEDEEDGDEDEDKKRDRAEADGPEDDESEEEESDESEDEEAEPSKAKPMSLFEKLKKFRDENPVSPASGDDSDVGSDAEGSMNEEDFDDASESRSLDDEAGEDEVLDNDEGESDEEGDDEW